MKKIIIFGPSILGEIVQHYLTIDSDYEVVAFSANQEYIKEKEFNGLPIIAFENIEKDYPPTEYSMFVAIGYQKMNKPREKIYNEAKNKGYKTCLFCRCN